MKIATKKTANFDTPETVTGSGMTGRMPSKTELKEMADLVIEVKAKNKKNDLKPGKILLSK